MANTNPKNPKPPTASAKNVKPGGVKRPGDAFFRTSIKPPQGVIAVTPMIIGPGPEGRGFAKAPIDPGLSQVVGRGSIEELVKAFRQVIKEGGGVEAVGAVHVIMRSIEEPEPEPEEDGD